MKKEIKTFFRSHSNLGDYNDDEINNLPSKTDPSQYESIQDLLNKALRGEKMNTSALTFDDVPENADPEHILPINERRDFDLSDVAQEKARIENAVVNGTLKMSKAPVKPANEPEKKPEPIKDPKLPKDPAITD